MANFKGGFAFNNEAAKVEVEQSPNGALISCINPVTGESMGGGNPNSVQVIEGTLANPFGDIAMDELQAAVISGNATAILEFNASALGFGTQKTALYYYGDEELTASYAGLTPAFSVAYYLRWNSASGDLEYAYVEEDGTVTDVKTAAASLPSTLTIYLHPMPEEGE